jgi:hypothetical protein
VAGHHVPEALDVYRQASAELLITLGAAVYPVLRDDLTNETRRYPIRYRRGGWSTFEIETPSGGLHYLVYQAIEEIRRVLVFDLVTFRGP